MEHGVDAFGQIGTAALVHARGVDPEPLATSLNAESGHGSRRWNICPLDEIAEALEFAMSSGGGIASLLDIFVGRFIGCPAVRRDVIRRDAALAKLLQLQCRHVQQPHLEA